MLGADIVHETYYSPVRAAPRRSRIVTTIHDMIYELNPDIPRAETYIANKRASLQRADRIICVSENTRRDLLHFYPHLEERTAVVLHGFDPPTSTAADAASLHARPYMLYVGMRWRGYKNFKGLLEAFASSNRLQQEVDLVCVGGGAFNAEELGTMREFGVVDRVIQRDADDAELHRWYSHAHLFVYPSLYEGFGFPPLEAMASSCPVVALRSSSIPEVCGAAVEYAEPGNPASLTAALELVAFSSERRAELAAAGRERTRAFSWEECARRTASIYRGLSG
jgi:glycosyltransferase involved in cell wall biosynthesis